MTDILSLREVLPSEIETLAERAKGHLPQSITVHGFLSFGFRLGSVDANRTKIFVPNRGSFPLFVVITGILNKEGGEQSITCFWDVCETSSEEVSALLKSLPNFDWAKPFFLFSCHSDILKEMNRFLFSPGGPSEGILCEYRSSTADLLFFEDTKALEIQRPDGVIVKEIPKSMASTVHQYWQYKFSYSPNDVERMVSKHPNSAVYIEDTSLSQGEETVTTSRANQSMMPVSWAIVKYNGEIGMTYTRENYRQKGYSKLVTMDLVEKLLKLGFTPFIFVDKSNPISKGIHERMGFETTEGEFTYTWYLFPGQTIQDIPTK